MPRAMTLPLTFGEPDLDLVKPRRVGGCKMNAHLGMVGHMPAQFLAVIDSDILSTQVSAIRKPRSFGLGHAVAQFWILPLLG